MAKKPTYEELEQRVKELEKEVAARKNAEKSLKEKTHLNNILLDAIPCVALLIRSFQEPPVMKLGHIEINRAHGV